MALLLVVLLWRRKILAALGFVRIRYDVLRRWQHPHPLRSAIMELGDLVMVRIVYGRWL